MTRWGWLTAVVLATWTHGQSGGPSLAGPPAATGPVWVVPLDGGAWSSFATIQDAVDAAVSGDTVLLSAGVYRGPGNRDVHVSGKDVRIEHGGDPARCVIDAQGLGQGFFFDGLTVTGDSLLRGVTVLNGLGIRGGGIRCDAGARPRIERCVVRGCQGSIGGGIYYFISSTMTFDRGSIVDCLVEGNSATGYGGGMHIAQVEVDRCTIMDNTSGLSGAGAGVGVSAVGAFGGIRNSVIARNYSVDPSPSPGGGISVQAYQFVIESCTVVYNKGNAGAGVAFWNIDPTATMTNTIVWGNEATSTAPQVWHHSPFGQFVATIRHCDIEGGTAGIVAFGSFPPNVSSIFDLDPEFLGGSSGDFQLSPGSPLIELGDPSLAPMQNEGDFQLEPRRFGLLDLGADEVHPSPSLTLPSPGRAGEGNAWTVRGAPPGGLVLFLGGLEPGVRLPYERCPTLAPGVADPAPLVVRLASSSGEASLRAAVPARFGGDRLLFQALTFDPLSGTCFLSEVVPFRFP